MTKALLWRALSLSLLSAPGAFAHAADNAFSIGGQLGGADISSEFTGEGSAGYHLRDNAGTNVGAFGAYDTQWRGHDYRVVAQMDYGAWDNADTMDILGGLDYVWKAADDSGGVYLGPRLGAFQFADDLTGDRSTAIAYGAEAGFLAPLSTLGSGYDQLRFGLFVRYLAMDIENEGTVDGGSLERNVELDRQATVGLQLLWTP